MELLANQIFDEAIVGTSSSPLMYSPVIHGEASTTVHIPMDKEQIDEEDQGQGIGLGMEGQEQETLPVENSPFE